MGNQNRTTNWTEMEVEVAIEVTFWVQYEIEIDVSDEKGSKW